MKCSIDGCERPRGRARGWCQMHYARWRRTGELGRPEAAYAKSDDPLGVRLEHIGWDVSPAGCWEWRGSRRPTGYGVVSIGQQKLEYTHRVSWQVHFGPIPQGAYVCHRCDNPPCLNPTHLFLADHDGNMADMVTKGRHAYGIRQGRAKLTPEMVREIRGQRDVSQHVIASRFGVSQSLISRIKNDQRWATEL